MPFVPLDQLLPSVAREETRSMMMMEAGEIVRSYLITELFCDEPSCDCRRAMFVVLSDEPGAQQPRATISWGWEPVRFYRDWASFPLSAEDIEELRGPALARLAPQSEEAEELLAQLRTILADERYADRVVRHYQAFRALVEQRGGRRPRLAPRLEPRGTRNQRKARRRKQGGRQR